MLSVCLYICLPSHVATYVLCKYSVPDLSVEMKKCANEKVLSPCYSVGKMELDWNKVDSICFAHGLTSSFA